MPPDGVPAHHKEHTNQTNLNFSMKTALDHVEALGFREQLPWAKRTRWDRTRKIHSCNTLKSWVTSSVKIPFVNARRSVTCIIHTLSVELICVFVAPTIVVKGWKNSRITRLHHETRGCLMIVAKLPPVILIYIYGTNSHWKVALLTSYEVLFFCATQLHLSSGFNPVFYKVSRLSCTFR